jgi:phage terminase small subunit
VLQNEKVMAFVDELRARSEHSFTITQAMVLEQLWQIATADPNELIQYRRINCRYCHGVDHGYQWRDDEEWLGAIQDEATTAKLNKTKPKDIPYGGGTGFRRTRPPAPDCPRCCGEGIGDPIITDTDKLEGSARRLYAGVKVTRDGIEVKMRDQDKALDLLATYVGLKKDKGDSPLNLNMFFDKVTRTIVDPLKDAAE